jgi:2-methylaconitate cis-trans-isomerase PrpF
MLDNSIPIMKSGTSLVAIIDVNKMKIYENLNITYLKEIIHKVKKKYCIDLNKFAVLTPESKELFFIQYIPSLDKIDLSGNCGNAVVAAYEYLIKHYGESSSINLKNTDKVMKLQLKSKVDSLNSIIELNFFDFTPTQLKSTFPLNDRLLFVQKEIESIPVSVVDVGNPYIWVRKKDISANSLSSWGIDEMRKLEDIRREIQKVLNIPNQSVFPKIAAFSNNKSLPVFEVKSISVPSWHPSFALTGIINLCYTISMDDTIINNELLKRKPTSLSIKTPSNNMKVSLEYNQGSIYCLKIEQKVTKIGEVFVDFNRNGLQEISI